MLFNTALFLIKNLTYTAREVWQSNLMILLYFSSFRNRRMGGMVSGLFQELIVMPDKWQ